MTEEHTKNLAALAAYLRAGGKPGVEFDMWRYDEGNSEGDYMTDCGSVGCAVGHGPYAGIPKMEDEYWEEYATRVFGIVPSTEDRDWLFAAHWRYSKFPGISDAAKRIEAFLNAGGRVPHGDDTVSDMIEWHEEQVSD